MKISRVVSLLASATLLAEPVSTLPLAVGCHERATVSTSKKLCTWQATLWFQRHPGATTHGARRNQMSDLFHWIVLNATPDLEIVVHCDLKLHIRLKR